MKITRDVAIELLHYDAVTGALHWKKTRQGRARAGAVAGSIRRDGYRKITINGVGEYAHRLVWLIERGEFPSQFIDHINGNPRDNRITNLREATARLNSQNRRGPCRGAPLIGAYWNKTHGRWQSRIRADGKGRHLGWFDTADQAHAAYVAAKRALHEGCTL